jgi:hypothetical protein
MVSVLGETRSINGNVGEDRSMISSSVKNNAVVVVVAPRTDCVDVVPVEIIPIGVPGIVPKEIILTGVIGMVPVDTIVFFNESERMVSGCCARRVSIIRYTVADASLVV